jgi:hypothetical protein
MSLIVSSMRSAKEEFIAISQPYIYTMNLQTKQSHLYMVYKIDTDTPIIVIPSDHIDLPPSHVILPAEVIVIRNTKRMVHDSDTYKSRQGRQEAGNSMQLFLLNFSLLTSRMNRGFVFGWCSNRRRCPRLVTAITSRGRGMLTWWRCPVSSCTLHRKNHSQIYSHCLEGDILKKEQTLECCKEDGASHTEGATL